MYINLAPIIVASPGPAKDSNKTEIEPPIVEIFDPAKTSFEAVAQDKPFIDICEQTPESILINANYFNEFSKETVGERIIGLLVSNNEMISQLASGKYPWIFLVTRKGSAHIIRANNYGKYVRRRIFAVQAKYLIIETREGKKIKSKDRTANFKRTVIAINKKGKVFLLSFNSKVYRQEVADWILKEYPRVVAALELDGGSSTARCNYGEAKIEPGTKVLPSLIKVTRE